MKITVKTLKGAQFDLHVEADASVVSVKRHIEEKQGRGLFPFEQQLLIHQGKVLKDESTLAENNVKENGFIVVMLTKKPSSTPPAATSASATSSATPAQSTPVTPPVSASPPPPPTTPVPVTDNAPSAMDTTPAATLPPSSPAVPAAPAPAPAPSPSSVGVYGSAASALVAGPHLEGVVQQLLDMGGGQWERETVLRALRAAFNNPERAVEYLYSGIPEAVELPAPVAALPPDAATAAAPGVPSPAAAASPVPAPAAAAAAAAPGAGPNASPLDLFPQGMPSFGGAGGGGSSGALDFLRSNPQFLALRAMVQSNPQILQPMLQELGKQNPQLLQLINSNQAEFLRLINDDMGDEQEGEENLSAPQTLSVTQEEKEAIDRLQSLGFDRALVIEAFFACDKNEQLAANYLLENAADFD